MTEMTETTEMIEMIEIIFASIVISGSIVWLTKAFEKFNDLLYGDKQ